MIVVLMENNGEPITTFSLGEGRTTTFHRINEKITVIRETVKQ